MKGSGRGNWDPREGQQAFRQYPNGVGDRTATFRRLLIRAAEKYVSSTGQNASFKLHTLFFEPTIKMLIFLAKSDDYGVKGIPLVPGPEIFRGPKFLKTSCAMLTIN